MPRFLAFLALAACFDAGARKSVGGAPSPRDDSSGDSPSDSGADNDTATTDSGGTETGPDSAADTSSDTSAPVEPTLVRVEPATGSTRSLSAVDARRGLDAIGALLRARDPRGSREAEGGGLVRMGDGICRPGELTA